MSRINKQEHESINKTLHFLLRFCVLQQQGINKTSSESRRLCKIVKIVNDLRCILDNQYLHDYPNETVESCPYYGINNDKYHKIGLSEFNLH